MRNLYEEELDILWDNYKDIMDIIGFDTVLTASTEELQSKFALKYKQIYYQVKDANSWKPKNVMKYNLLKLRRLFAIWKENNIVLIEGGVSYSERDTYKQFPKYNMQNPTVYPTEKTINKLRVKALVGYVEEKQLKDLRSLRASLIRGLGFDNDTANFLTKLYGKMQARSEVNKFSEKSYI